MLGSEIEPMHEEVTDMHACSSITSRPIEPTSLTPSSFSRSSNRAVHRGHGSVKRHRRLRNEMTKNRTGKRAQREAKLPFAGSMEESLRAAASPASGQRSREGTYMHAGESRGSAESSERVGSAEQHTLASECYTNSTLQRDTWKTLQQHQQAGEPLTPAGSAMRVWDVRGNMIGAKVAQERAFWASARTFFLPPEEYRLASELRLQVGWKVTLATEKAMHPTTSTPGASTGTPASPPGGAMPATTEWRQLGRELMHARSDMGYDQVSSRKGPSEVEARVGVLPDRPDRGGGRGAAIEPRCAPETTLEGTVNVSGAPPKWEDPHLDHVTQSAPKPHAKPDAPLLCGVCVDTAEERATIAMQRAWRERQRVRTYITEIEASWGKRRRQKLRPMLAHVRFLQDLFRESRRRWPGAWTKGGPPSEPGRRQMEALGGERRSIVGSGLPGEGLVDSEAKGSQNRRWCHTNNS